LLWLDKMRAAMKSAKKYFHSGACHVCETNSKCKKSTTTGSVQFSLVVA
jgi:hypothetical protein